MLDCFLPFSWAGLTALNGFVPQTMQLEVLRFIGIGNSDGPHEVLPEFVSSLRVTLSVFQPVKLNQVLDYYSTWFLLETLNLDRLQTLHIEVISTRSNPLRSYVNIKPIMPIIEAMNLSHLTIEFGHLTRFIHFFEHISAKNLKSLEANIWKNHKDRKKYNNEMNYLSSKGIESSLLNLYVRRICRVLEPSAEGIVKFPNLQNIRIRIQLHIPQYTSYEPLVPAMNDDILSMLQRRSRCGAIGLRVEDSVQVEVDNNTARKNVVRLQAQFKLVLGDILYARR